jgi:hypothetical protein
MSALTHNKNIVFLFDIAQLQQRRILVSLNNQKSLTGMASAA